jgi:hypothetical protein
VHGRIGWAFGEKGLEKKWTRSLPPSQPRKLYDWQ